MTKKDDIRLEAESDFYYFIGLVHPQRLLGSIHAEIISWWTRQDHKSHQLLLLPRDHMKSALVAYRAAWEITKNPTIRILYISSTANLAIKQIKFIKDILTSSIYRRYWPEMVHPEEGKREKWTESEFSVDHPLRSLEAVRDPTVFTAGLTTSITGLHCDIAILDDVVVNENAYTTEGREKVQTQYSLLSSIEGTEADEWVVGTRYHPKDLYNDMLLMTVDMYDEHGEVIDNDPLYEVMERQVEDLGDGTGQFLWPRQRRYDGKFFGFDLNILAKKRAQYLDRLQFRAQYYNDPNDPASAAINRDNFQYYEPKFLGRDRGRWLLKNRPLNVFAAIDFAFSLEKKADFTAIVVVGVDANRNYYVLDIERFKTYKISDYFNKILSMHRKWDFRQLIAEVSTAQKVIVRDLRDNYVRPHNLALSIKEHSPTRHQGKKEERIENILQHRYDNMQMWHYRGGNCQVLEEELVLQNPPHDDVKDALAACIEHAQPPSMMSHRRDTYYIEHREAIMANRFGGIV